MRSRMWERRILAKYFLVQGMSWAALGLAALVLRQFVYFPWWLGFLCLGAWILKDVLLYALTWRSYDTGVKKERTPAVGRIAIAASDLDPKGYVMVGDELWSARLSGPHGFAAKGTPVRITAADGLAVTVEPADPKAP